MSNVPVRSPVLPCEAAAKAQTSPPPPPPPKKKVTVKGYLFFDGTENNMWNILERNEKWESAKRAADDVPWWDSSNEAIARLAEKSRLDEDSYKNDLSNVARLYRAAPMTGAIGVDAFAFSVYVDGIGTKTGGADSTYGKATGRGDFGVPTRAADARDIVLSKIVESAPASAAVSVEVQLHAFGFSRGAAAARHFVYLTMQGKSGQTLEKLLLKKGYGGATVAVKFVGLFDTVASYGVNHEDDTKELHLDAVALADAVVHLVAADEYRLNFPVTNIKSCGSKGREIYLPGVHSDVGGGYNKSVNENSRVAFRLPVNYAALMASSAASSAVGYALPASSILESAKAEGARIAAELTWLKKRGWTHGASSIVSTHAEVRVTRHGIQQTYSFIPLRIMRDLSKDGGVVFDDTLEDQAWLDDGLLALKAADGQPVCEHLQAHARQGGSRKDWTEDWIQPLRGGYFHMSAYHEGFVDVNQPQYFSAADGYGTGYSCVMHGQRRRKVHDG